MLASPVGNLAAAADGNAALLQVLTALAANQAAQAVVVNPTSTPAPKPGTLQVVGTDGHFKVTITPDDQLLANTALQMAQQAADAVPTSPTLVFQLQSALNTKFDASSTVTDYGVSNALTYDITDPNKTKYWRYRESADQGETFGDWIYMSDPTLCGVVPVWSGLLKNSSIYVNNAASTPTGANPCTQVGVTTAVAVAASVWTLGDQVISYNSGSVDPGSFGTWLIYAKDPQRTGGTVTFLATTASSDITSDNTNIYFGKITTSGGGGGTGGDAGGGTCCRAGVTYRRFNGADQDCSTLRMGDDLLAVDGGKEIIQNIVIHPSRPCFRIEFDDTGKLKVKTYIGDFTVYEIQLDRSHTFIVGANKIVDGACSTHTIQYGGGGFVSVFDAVVDEPFNVIGGGIGSHNNQKA